MSKPDGDDWVFITYFVCIFVVLIVLIICATINPEAFQ